MSQNGPVLSSNWPIYSVTFGLNPFLNSQMPQYSFSGLKTAVINLVHKIKQNNEEVNIEIKYEGYIVKANREAEKMLDLDNKKIPEDIDYDKIHNHKHKK